MKIDSTISSFFNTKLSHSGSFDDEGITRKRSIDCAWDDISGSAQRNAP